MRVGGHDGVACGFGPLYQGQGPVAQQFLSLRCMLAHVKAQVGRDLLIAAAAGVELQGQLANVRGQFELDEMMHVFGTRIGCQGGAPSAVPAVLEHGIQPIAHLGGLGRRQNAGGSEHARVRLAGSNLLGEKPPVKAKGPLPLLKARIERLAEAARPHLHFTTSFCFCSSRARVRAGSPRIWMKPLASF